MKLWLIFIQGDETTWLQDAWDDQSIAESAGGWEDAVKSARATAKVNNAEIRIATTEVAGVYGLFESPNLQATTAQPQEVQVGSIPHTDDVGAPQDIDGPALWRAVDALQRQIAAFKPNGAEEDS
jgi:hypothetical protein